MVTFWRRQVVAEMEDRMRISKMAAKFYFLNWVVLKIIH